MVGSCHMTSNPKTTLLHPKKNDFLLLISFFIALFDFLFLSIFCKIFINNLSQDIKDSIFSKYNNKLCNLIKKELGIIDINNRKENYNYLWEVNVNSKEKQS